MVQPCAAVLDTEHTNHPTLPSDHPLLGFCDEGLFNVMPMPGVKCPKCASKGVESWVLPGKSCPKCGTACG